MWCVHVCALRFDTGTRASVGVLDLHQHLPVDSADDEASKKAERSDGCVALKTVDEE